MTDVMHLNGNPADNRVENLRYGTHRDNQRMMVDHGTHVSARKTRCPQGHKYDRVSKDGRRRCKRCEAAAQRRYRSRKRSTEVDS